MKVSMSDMTGRELIVITKRQLDDFLDSYALEIQGAGRGPISVDIEWPDVIEVEEVLGE